MTSNTRKVFILSMFILSSVQIGCDSFSGYFDGYSDQQESEIGVATEPSYEKTLLLETLEKQRELVGQLLDAHAYGDKSAIKELYEAVLRLDQSYQEEFEKYEGEMSYPDSIEISKKHSEIIKSIPSYSSLMK